MKFLNRKRILVLLSIKLLISMFGIHTLYMKYEIFNESCNENIGMIVRNSFIELDPKMVTNKTIYFLETSNSSDIQLTARQACAIESAAFMNPDKQILVLILTTIKYTRVRHWHHLEQLSNYKNIRFRYFHVDDFIKDTPLENWMRNEVLRQSSYKTLHLSDMLRYALLYKYSGLYLDLDVIMMHSIDNIKNNNFACFEENRKRFQSINNAILRISDSHGRDFAKLLLNEVIENYDAHKQWEIGPRLVTKTLKKFCGIEDFTKSTECENFKILSPEKCYAVQGYQWYKFYEEYYTDSVLKDTKDSFFVHLWNFQSSKKKVNRTRNIAFNIIAFKYCPYTYLHNTEL